MHLKKYSTPRHPLSSFLEISNILNFLRILSGFVRDFTFFSTDSDIVLSSVSCVLLCTLCTLNTLPYKLHAIQNKNKSHRENGSKNEQMLEWK